MIQYVKYNSGRIYPIKENVDKDFTSKKFKIIRFEDDRKHTLWLLKNFDKIINAPRYPWVRQRGTRKFRGFTDYPISIR